MQHSSDISCPGDLAVFVRGRCEGKGPPFMWQAGGWDRDRPQSSPGCLVQHHFTIQSHMRSSFMGLGHGLMKHAAESHWH